MQKRLHEYHCAAFQVVMYRKKKWFLKKRNDIDFQSKYGCVSLSIGNRYKRKEGNFYELQLQYGSRTAGDWKTYRYLCRQRTDRPFPLRKIRGEKGSERPERKGCAYRSHWYFRNKSVQNRGRCFRSLRRTAVLPWNRRKGHYKRFYRRKAVWLWRGKLSSYFRGAAHKGGAKKL